MRVLFSLLTLCLALSEANAQAPVGSWRAMLNYSEAIDVDVIGQEMYVAVDNAIFIYNKSDHSVETLTRINGLSDVSIRMLKAVPEKQTLIIGYENGNIDLLKNRTITNIPDVRNSSLPGNKAIRHASIGPEFIYLSTGLGVLAFDIDRREIRNTYRIVAAENVSVNQTTLLNNILYAATDQGLYFGSIDNDLTNFNNWEIDLGVPEPFSNVDHCVASGNQLFINQTTGTQPGMYRRTDNGLWDYLINSQDLRSMRATPGGLIITTSGSTQLRSDNGQEVLLNISNYSGIPSRPSRAHAEEDGTLWIADNNRGLVNRTPSGEFEFIAPDGPGSNGCFSLTFERGELWVASGAANRPGLWSNRYQLDGFYKYQNQKWTNYTKNSFPVLEEAVFFDIVNVYRYPEAEERILVSSWYSGIFEMVNGEIVNWFTDENSTLDSWDAYNRGDGKPWVGSIGHTADSEGNVWMLSARSDIPLSVYRSNGTWKGFSLDGAIRSTSAATHMIINQQGHHWIVVNRDGLVVVDATEGIDAAPKIRTLTAAAGNGGLPTNEVFCITEDLDGIIWVGTNDGIGVFFSPFDIFNITVNQNNDTSFVGSDARPILVEQDGIFQPLFENQPISVITVDGANRKWVGTYGSGVFLMSADGTEQLLNFTTANSPLLSNSINDIAVNSNTGEVYIASEEGILVYGGDATSGKFENSCSSVFPNPVRENYQGAISITGLMRDTEVRITDVRGNLVASITSGGGTAVWDGRNLNNERVSTGVYFAMSSDPEGQSTCVSKILVVK
jgi:ligand-binding sensor domain-containing protein